MANFIRGYFQSPSSQSLGYSSLIDDDVGNNKKDDNRGIQQVEKFCEKCRSYRNISTLKDKEIEKLAKELVQDLNRLQLNEENKAEIAKNLERVACQSERCSRALYGRLSDLYPKFKGTSDEKLWYSLTGVILFTISRQP